MEEFIEKRATGMTLAQAARDLNISRKTAVNWERKHRENIDAVRAIMLEELMDKYRMTKERRIELFGQQLLAVQAELKNRGLSDVTTAKLMDMAMRLSKLLESEAVQPKFMTSQDVKLERERRESKGGRV
jgi:transcriptional regulator with XRE-family HTH domain